MSIKIYKSTDVDISISVVGIAIGDITAATVSLEMSGASPITFSTAAGTVTIGASSLNLRIEDNKITTPGVYMIRITVTENSNIRGLTPNPNFLTVA